MANRILQRVIVGVLVGIILGAYHKISRAETFIAATGYGTSNSSGAATYSDKAALCAAYKAANYPSSGYTMTLQSGGGTGTNYSGYVCTLTATSNGQWLGQTQIYSFSNNFCPSGTTKVGTSCESTLSCSDGQVRSTLSATYGQCVASAECTYPNTDNGDGQCANHACPDGQYRVPATNQCAVPAQCNFSVETYNSDTNTCVYVQQCLEHKHLVNGECVWDDPIYCPAGQHDSGTYVCVADEPTHCPPGWQSGKINGVTNCIEPPHLDTKAQAAAAAAQAALEARQNYNTAQQAYDQAKEQYYGDTTNITYRDTYTSAGGALSSAQSALTNAESVATQAQSDYETSLSKQGLSDNSSQLSTIAEKIDQTNQHLQTSEDKKTTEDNYSSTQAAKGLGLYGEISSDAGIPTTTIAVPSSTGGGSGGGSGVGSGGGGSCPAASSVSVAGHSIDFSMVMNMACSLVSSMRNVIIPTAYLYAAYIVIGAI